MRCRPGLGNDKGDLALGQQLIKHMKGEAQRWSLISLGEWKDASGRRYLIRREISVRLDAKEQKVI